MSMLAAPLTDHSVISPLLKPHEPQFYSKGYWKFNSHLLSHETYCMGVRQLIRQVMDMEDFSSYIQKWEFFKYKIRQYSIAYSKDLKKSQRQAELQLIKKLNDTCKKPTLTDSDKQTHLTLQTDLDDIYARKTKGAFIRSRARWIEEGEKILRKQKNEIRSLMINNNLCQDQKTISKELLAFYSQPSSQRMMHFLWKALNAIFHIFKKFLRTLVMWSYRFKNWIQLSVKLKIPGS